MVGNVEGLTKDTGNSVAMDRPVSIRAYAAQQSPDSDASPLQAERNAAHENGPKDIVDIQGLKKEEQNKANEKEKELSTEDVKAMNEQLNKFMDSMNSNIHFDYYEDLNQMLVQIINRKTKEVIKEFPPKEILDKLVGLREWIGTILDKKA